MAEEQEQEREVDHEVERERHRELPPKVHPAEHIVCDEIRNFRHIIPLFASTGIDEALNSMKRWSPAPLATTDFAVTTTNSSTTHLTDYLRPVNWILSSGSGKDSIAIVISPYEANELLPIIRKSGKSPAEEWTAAAHLRTELNLFAGQLYFDSEEEYWQVCVLLALHMAHPGAEHIEVDGFVPPAYRTDQSSPLTTSVIATLKRLTGLRTKGKGFGGTDLGRVLDARPLSSEFASWVRE
ncbi:hypothetical protein EDB83DRAFT_2364999 [Lactarius deliciosus]|nr:hypothetical protein EDB83DRAFT_2364999 [Lactarius deliciosus]